MPLTTRPTMYAVWLRKNGDESTWIWWLASSRNGRGKRRRNAASTLRRSRPKSAKRRSNRQVEHDVDQRMAQALLQRVVAAVRRRIGVDVLGGDHRPHEDEPVVEVPAAQRLDGDGVEERLRALRLLVVDQEPDEVELDLLPTARRRPRRRGRRSRYSRSMCSAVSCDAAVVEVDAVARDVLDGEPVAGLEVASRRARALAEHGVVPVEAVEQHAGDAARLLGGGCAWAIAAGEAIGVAIG